jgi:hypothetical protein
VSDTDLGSGGTMDMQLAAAAILADNKDVKVLLRVLATTLADTFGERVRVEQSGGARFRHKGDSEVRAVTVPIGADEYQVRLEGHGVTCSVGRSSGGIRIRNEQLPIEEWLRRLLGALQAEAATNQSARTALENIVIGGNA